MTGPGFDPVGRARVRSLDHDRLTNLLHYGLAVEHWPLISIRIGCHRPWHRVREAGPVMMQTRRRSVRRGQRGLMLGSILAAVSLGSSAVASAAPATPATSPDASASAIADVVRNAMDTDHLRAVIVKVTQGDRVLISQALGTSMDGVPATTDMHFRNGAVAFAYLGTLLMQFVDERKVRLDDTIDRWMPTLPEANKVTLKMLANQTSGYPDYETDPKWLPAWTADPFHIWTFDERMKYAFRRPMQFEPGTNWSYAHTNFMILGEILSRIGGKPLDTLLREKVLDPM